MSAQLLLRPPSLQESPFLFKTLSVEDKGEFVAHFERLSPQDRRARFLFTLNIEAIKRYIDKLESAQGRMFGVYSKDVLAGGALLAGVCHLAYDKESGLAEVALSVDSQYRKLGFGLALMRQAIVYAKEERYSQLKVICFSDNRAMYSLAQRVGFHMESNGLGTSEGFLEVTSS